MLHGPLIVGHRASPPLWLDVPAGGRHVPAVMLEERVGDGAEGERVFWWGDAVRRVSFLVRVLQDLQEEASRRGRGGSCGEPQVKSVRGCLF